jgi:hypothetical protein
VARDSRYALHGPMDDPEGQGGEFLVSGTMEPIAENHPAAVEISRATTTPLAFYALMVMEVVGTTYEGPGREPLYRRWREVTR